MPPIDPQTIATVFILAGSACLQATVGFAAGLMGIPLLIWAGNSLPEAQVLIITAMLPQNALLLWKLRSHTSLSETALPALVRLSFMPLGLFGLAWLISYSTVAIKPLVGAVVLGAVLTQAFNGRRWQTAGRWYWVVATFGLSGLLQGLSGMSAPPMLLWVHGQRFSVNRARSFLFAMYLSNFLPQLALMLWAFGPKLLNCVLLAAQLRTTGPGSPAADHARIAGRSATGQSLGRPLVAADDLRAVGMDGAGLLARSLAVIRTSADIRSLAFTRSLPVKNSEPIWNRYLKTWSPW